MYPAYRPRDVLEEYAIVFYTMLAEGYRQRYRHYEMLARVFSVPYMEDEPRKKFMHQLEWASKDPSDILKPDDDVSSITDLKNFLGKI